MMSDVPMGGHEYELGKYVKNYQKRAHRDVRQCFWVRGFMLGVSKFNFNRV